MSDDMPHEPTFTNTADAKAAFEGVAPTDAAQFRKDVDAAFIIEEPDDTSEIEAANIAALRDAVHSVYGENTEEVNEYIKGERDSWELGPPDRP